jgi:uncharacterized protein YbaP (TraB family)
MNKAVALADRAAAATLKLVALANLLFLLSFAAAIALATGRAQAETVACTGTNLLAELQREDPAKLDQIRAEAAETPNGKGLLWKIEKPGREPSFLFGTMHVTDPRVTELTPAARAAFEASDTVVIETTDILDQAGMMASLMQHPELMMFTDSTTLTSLMTPEDAAIVEAGLRKRGVPLASVAKMKPWMLSALVALPACELARKNAGAPVLDVKLAADAKAAGKELAGLETARSQLEAMASLPMEFHLRGLADTLKLGDRIDDVIETMVVLYTQGETAAFWPLFNAVLPAGEGEQSGFAAFEETMISARNKSMAESAEPILAKGAAFIAVGALHLPGEQGLVELFRKTGYKVSPGG